MKYVVATPKSVLLVATILTLALFTSIYPIIQWKPVFASPDTAEDYVDIQSDVDSVIDKGTHSNFTAQMYGPDLINDTLTEENTGGDGGVTIEDYVDQISDVDGIADIGTHSAFANMKASDSSYDLLSEADVSSGAYWWFNRTDTQQYGTNTAYQSTAIHTLSFTAPAQGDYLIISSAGIASSSTANAVHTRTQLDNTITISEAAVVVGTVYPAGFKPFSNFYLAEDLAAGSHYVDMDAYIVTSGTWYMDYAHITVLRLDDWLPTAGMYASTQTTAASNVGTGVANAFQTQATLTFTPDSAGDYLVLAMVQLTPVSTIVSALARLNYGSGTEYLPLSNTEESTTNPLVFEGRIAGDINSWTWGGIVSLTVASQTFLLETGMSSTATGANGCSNKRIIAIRIAAMDSSAHTTEDASVTSTTSQYTTKSTVSFTPSSSKDFLILGGIVNKPDTTLAPTGSRFIQSAGDEISNIGLVQHDSKDSSIPADAFPFFTSSVRSWTAQTQTVEMQYGYGLGASGTAYGKGSFIVVIEKPSAPTADYQMDMEVQFTEAIDYLSVEKVCIQTGTFSGSEDINVTYWTGSTWSSITSDLTASTWNNYTVSVTSATFTIKFGGSTTSSDEVQDTWNIDAVLLQLSGAGSNEYIVDNQDSDVDSSADRGTITSFANMQDYPSNYATLTETTSVGDITKVGTDTTGTGTTSPLSFSHTLVAGSNRLVVVSVGIENGANYDVTSVTYGGNTMIKAVDGATGTTGFIMLVEIWYILEANLPSNGAQTVVITGSGTETEFEINGFCSEYTGVTQSAPEKVNATAYTGTDKTITNTITPSNNAWVISCVGCGNTNTPWEHGSPQVEVLDFNDASSTFAVAELRGASGQTYLNSTTTGTVNRMERVCASWIPTTGDDNYVLDQEVQFINLQYAFAIESLNIATGTTGAEDILIDVWDGNSWENVLADLAGSTWNNVSITTYLTGITLTIRFRDGTQTGDTSIQDSWQINIAIIYIENGGGNNYELDLEEQFVNVNYTRTNEELCIYMGAFNAGGETLAVQWWNSTDSSWLTIISSLSTSQWNNVSVTDYLTSATFTIRFIDGTKTSDSSQGTWQKDACLLHIWTLGYNLNLRVMDLDLTDNIQGAYVYKDSDVKTSDAEGWANWTLVSGTVEIKVQYFGFWVNGTFSVTIDSDKTINVQCKLYDVTVLVQEGVQNAYLASANVTVYNSTSVQDNKITSGVTGNNGQVQLLNLPNNTLMFTQYGGASYSLVIGNTTPLVSSENQTITLTANQNNINTNNNYSIIAFAGMTIPLKGAFAKRRLKKKRNRDMECEKKRAHKTSGKSHN
jgi:hypothetical protein